MTKHEVRPQRADWQRNHDRLLATASALVARDGAQVSLEEIAREAGVGSATLHRHFPSRRVLPEEVFQDTVERLRRRAAELAAGDDPRKSLVTWLEELTIAAANTRGLSASLAAGSDDGFPPGETCHAVMREATTTLTDRARATNAVRPEVTPEDLLTLTSAVAQIAEGDPPAAHRLLHLALNGIWP